MLTTPQFSSPAQTSFSNSRLVCETSYSTSSPGCLTDISNYVNLSTTPHQLHLLESLSYKNLAVILDSSLTCPICKKILLVLPSKCIQNQTTSTATPGLSHSHLSLALLLLQQPPNWSPSFYPCSSQSILNIAEHKSNDNIKTKVREDSLGARSSKS